jgi:ABC-type multidrug transport system ATPase subunit
VEGAIVLSRRRAEVTNLVSQLGASLHESSCQDHLEAANAGPLRIEIRGLNFSYETSPVFLNFNFESESRVSVLRGPSGCGKTTLLKLLYGLVTPDSAEKWEVPAPGFLVLQSDTLVPWFSGRDNIRRFSESVWDRVRNGPFYELLRPFIMKRACEMSYGQRRTIELARAFSAEPPILLLDEPFNFLDPEKRRFFLNYLNGRGGERLSRIVLTSHYVEDVPIGGADSFEFRGDMPHSALTMCGVDST